MSYIKQRLFDGSYYDGYFFSRDSEAMPECEPFDRRGSGAQTDRDIRRSEVALLQPGRFRSDTLALSTRDLFFKELETMEITDPREEAAASLYHSLVRSHYDTHAPNRPRRVKFAEAMELAAVDGFKIRCRLEECRDWLYFDEELGHLRFCNHLHGVPFLERTWVLAEWEVSEREAE